MLCGIITPTSGNGTVGGFDINHQQETNNGSSIPGLLNRVRVHINANGARYITPRDVGLGIGLSDGEAFVLLELLVKANVLKRAYNVYCILTDTIVSTVQYLETLDEVSTFCPTCNTEHDPSQLRVEIAFEEINGNFKEKQTK